MENISSISIRLCVLRMKNSKNKKGCFKSLDNTFSNISYHREIFTEISEEIINYTETTNENEEKLNSQKIAWIREWAQIKTKENLPFVEKMIMARTGETLLEYMMNQTNPIIDGVIKIPLQKHSSKGLNEESDNLFKLNDENIIKIYNKCNGEQWNNISISEFLNLLNSNGEYQSLTINKDEINRTKCVFRKVASYIENKEIRKTWIECIKRHIFNDVDFMKATLRINKLSSGYSESDVKFKPFLDSL